MADTQPTLIFHHYANSPFSEKVRLVFGFKRLAWHSVNIPNILPKPDVVALTGGYRKTPVLQIGADIYCDTALICEELDRIAPTPPLYPEPLKGVARVLAQWADSTLFWAAMAHNFNPQASAAMFAGAPPEVAQQFSADRAAMSTGMTRLRAPDAATAYQSYLRRLSHMLESQKEQHEPLFLLGQSPCIADFAAYHSLWFTKKIVPIAAPILEATPAVLDWMGRMAAFGHGVKNTLAAADAIAVAKQATAVALAQDLIFQDDHGIPLGAEVTIAAETFGQEPTQGTLVAATRTRYTLRHTNERVGTVHVHFPRVGFVLRKG